MVQIENCMIAFDVELFGFIFVTNRYQSDSIDISSVVWNIETSKRRSVASRIDERSPFE